MSCCPSPVLVDVEVLGLYDGCLYRECLTCGHRTHLHPEGSWLRAKAAPFVDSDADRP